MSLWRHFVRGVVALGLACLALAGCSNGEYVVVVRFETPALAASVDHVEVSLVASCVAQGSTGSPPTDARQTIDFARGAGRGALADAAPGTYGLYARGSSSTCTVVARGCADVTLAAGGEGALVVTLSPVTGPSCPPGTACNAGACRSPDAGTDAARLDAGAPDAGAFDAGAFDSGGLDSGGLDSGGLDAGSPCVPGPDSCSGGMLTHCAPGGLVTTTCPLGCAPADATRCARFVASNVPSALLAAAAGTVSIAGTTSLDTDGCSLAGAATSVETQSDGTELCVVTAATISVDAGAILSVRGARPLVLLASGDLSVLGTIDVSAYGATPGAGGGSGGGSASANGTGDAPGQGGRRMMISASSSADSGGGGGATCGSGGAGGLSAGVGGGMGGVALAPSELVPLHAGSGGGRGADAMMPGTGGAGGGALQLSAGGSITITGSVLAGGGGGGGGASSCTTGSGAGGGGGSGGAILIEAPTVSVGGSVVVRATGGGGGGAGSTCSAGGSAGGAGQDGALAADTAMGGTSGGAATGAAGGAGGGGATLDGAPGAASGGPWSSGNNGGGGGGGAGCVLFRQSSGSLPTGLTGASPSIAPGLRALVVRID